VITATTRVKARSAGLAAAGLAAACTHTFTQHYYDSRGVVRTYQMTLDGRAWKL
jgi:hypothetical protein